MRMWPSEQRWPSTGVVMAVALALCLPALRADFFTDDHVLLAEIEGRVPGKKPWDLYSFCPDAEAAKWIFDTGIYPWWTDPEIRIHLFRPLPSLLMSAEHAAFGRWAMGYHLVTLAAFAAMLLVASRLLRSALPGAPAVAGVAFAVFAWNDLQAQPAVWMADRHSLLAALVGFAGVWLHVRRREAGARWGGVAAPSLGALSLLCSEVGLQPLAYVLAYELVRRRKVTPVLPSAALAVAYLGAYRALGFGTRGSGTYLDPGSDPLGFLAALPARLAAFAADLLAGVPLDLWLFSPGIRTVLVGIGLAALAVFGWAMWRARPGVEGVGWLLAGAALAAIPATPGAPGSRLLLVPGLGAAAGIAALVLKLPSRSRTWGALAVVLVVVHLVLQPLELLGQVVAIETLGHRTEQLAREVPAGPNAEVVLLRVADPQVGIFAGVLRMLSGPPVRSWHLLTMSPCEHRLARAGPETLDVQLVGCRMMESDWERLLNAHPFTAGQVVQLSGLKVEIAEVEAGAPTHLRFTFDRALDDPDLVLLTWRDGALRRIELPPQR